MFCNDALFTQGVYCCLTQLMGGQLCHKGRVQAEVGERHRHAGLASRVGDHKPVGLHKTQAPIWVQAHHDLAEAHCSFHQS